MGREEAINEMLQYFDEKAEVGIFWYHPTDNELFEIHSIPVTSLGKDEITYPKLHKTIWTKLHQRTKDRKRQKLNYDPIYLNDYTQVPRGRIFFKEGEFHVFVGSWITDDIKQMIIIQFHLQTYPVKFKIDTHWEIGHGWSTEEDLLDFD